MYHVPQADTDWAVANCALSNGHGDTGDRGMRGQGFTEGRETRGSREAMQKEEEKEKQGRGRTRNGEE